MKPQNRGIIPYFVASNFFMKQACCLLFFFISVSLFPAKSISFVPGQTLNYKAFYGFLEIGAFTLTTDKLKYKTMGHVCNKVTLKAQTNGIARLFYMNDTWISYLDFASLETYKSYRHIQEGKYRLQEIVYFDHKNNKASVKVKAKNSNGWYFRKQYDTKSPVRDVVAAFVYATQINYSKIKKGTILKINGFYPGKDFSIGLKYEGKEMLEKGTIRRMCYKLHPILPENKVFDGVDAVEIWISADTKQQAVFGRAKLFLGNFELEIVD